MLSPVSYLIILILSFSGIFVGGILALIAPEELKSGAKYWKSAKYFFLAILIVLVLYYSFANSFIIAGIAISAVLAFLKIVNREYPALSIVLFFSSTNANFAIAVASLIFIYGLFEGTLQAMPLLVNKMDKYRRISLKKAGIVKIAFSLIKNNILFLLFGIILLPLWAYLQ